MNLSRIAAPATGLLTLAEAKTHLRVNSSDEDTYITALVARASAYLDARDGVLGEALVTQTWRLSFSFAPDGAFELPIQPVQSITVIKYFDTANVEQTFSAANYRLANNKVELVDGKSWPSVAGREIAFWVDFVAGYGAAADVPETVRHLCAVMVADLYENRASVSEATLSETPAATMLMMASRSYRGLF